MSDRDTARPAEPWETRKGWEKEVASGVLRHPIAPRDARLIVEIAGRLMSAGAEREVIVAALLAVGLDLPRTHLEPLSRPYPWDVGGSE